MFVRKMIHDALMRPGVRDSHTHVGFYPSSASVEYEDEDGDLQVVGACLRQQFYAHCGIPRTEMMSEDTAVKLELGNWCHEMLVEMVKRAGYWLGDEIRMFTGTELPVSGRADLFLRDPRDDSPVGCEIKSVGGYYGVKMTIKGPDARPKKEHVLQCLPYLDFYGKYGLTRWILLYIDRDSGAMAEYVIMLEDDGSANVQGEGFAEIWRHINLKSIKARWAKLREYIDAGELPPRDYTFQWSNKQILKKKKNGELTKTDTTAVDRKIKSGKTDEPLLKKGDWNCAYCDWKGRCPNEDEIDGKDVVPITSPMALPANRLAAMKSKKKAATDTVSAGDMF